MQTTRGAAVLTLKVGKVIAKEVAADGLFNAVRLLLVIVFAPSTGRRSLQIDVIVVVVEHDDFFAGQFEIVHLVHEGGAAGPASIVVIRVVGLPVLSSKHHACAVGVADPQRVVDEGVLQQGAEHESYAYALEEKMR